MVCFCETTKILKNKEMKVSHACCMLKQKYSKTI